MARTYAFCFASGHIDFGTSIPDGALPIARGQDKPLRNVIDATARHGYKTRLVNGRPTKIPGTDHLLVPGVPEAELLGNDPLDALAAYTAWITDHCPNNVVTIHSKHITPAEALKRAKRRARQPLQAGA